MPPVDSLLAPIGGPGPGPDPVDRVHAGSADLATLLAAAPFGLEIVGPDGRTLFANAFSENAASNPSLQARPFHLRLGARQYTVKLTTDDTAEIEHQKKLFRMAYFDELTGLPNRVVLEQSVAALIEQGATPFAIAFIDLDRFRNVNDYFGRVAGDELLTKVAGRIGSHLRGSDLLARLSGNAFVLLLSIDGTRQDAAARLQVIAERIKEPFVIDGQEMLTSASIGVSVFPDDGHVFGTLTWNAERAMRGSRLDMLGGVRFYDRSMERAVADKNRAEQRLRLAIRDRRLACAYQPKLDLRTGAIAGVEVLMRWRDEDGNVQLPGELLSVATELGLIDDIAFIVLDQTVESIDRIRDVFGSDCSVSINIAARQAGMERFMREFVDRLEATGFADRIIVEVTEEAFLSKDTFQKKILPMIREIGARVSIDDFGTGYSSLSALADITADEVKIDRSFITDVDKRPRSQNVLKAIEALGHSLGMEIVVEGVETPEELAYLKANTRIHLGQGHLFARPLLLDDIEASRAGGARSHATTRPVQAARLALNRSSSSGGR